jgi:hypothetical protein
MLDVKLFDEVWEQVKRYAGSHFGIPNGPDYPDFCKVISESEPFTREVVLSLIMLMASELELGEKIEEAKRARDSDTIGKRFIESIRTTTIFSQHVETLYLGYRLGRRIAEIERLEGMVK